MWHEISNIRGFIFHFPSHLIAVIFTAILSSSLTAMHQSPPHPTQHLWCTLGWISTFGSARHGVSFHHPRPWMRRSWRESALSAPVTAACLIGASPHCWHDMMGDDTEQQHVGSQMLAGASGRQRPWQTPLYSFNPMVLKQHLTQIEVGFVCCRGTGKKNEREERREMKGSSHFLSCTLFTHLLCFRSRRLSVGLEAWCDRGVISVKFSVFLSPSSLTSIPAGQMSFKVLYSLLWTLNL